MVNVVVVYCLPILSMVWQRSGSCSCEWLYCISLLFKVWLRSCSCCCCYIVYHYCLRFERRVVHVILVDYIVYHYCLRFDRGEVHVFIILSTITFKIWQRSGSCCYCYIVYQYSLRFDRGVVHVVVVILATITI